MTDENEIGIVEFAHQLSTEIGQFFDYWCAHMDEGLDNFPEKMIRGEWDEQFWAWYTSVRGTGTKKMDVNDA